MDFLFDLSIIAIAAPEHYVMALKLNDPKYLTTSERCQVLITRADRLRNNI